MTFLDFLHQRIEQGGFTTEDVLASLLPLLRRRPTITAPAGSRRSPELPTCRSKASASGTSSASRRSRFRFPRCWRWMDPCAVQLEIVGETPSGPKRLASAGTSAISLQIGKRGEPITRPVYLPGYVSWEHELGQHDPLTDIFSAGMLLASLACGLDFSVPEELDVFVRQRRPVERQSQPAPRARQGHRAHDGTEPAPPAPGPPGRRAKPSRITATRTSTSTSTLHGSRNSRPPTAAAGKRSSSAGCSSDSSTISRRNRLLHFRPTVQTVNLTWASVPLSFDVKSIRAEQILTWNSVLQDAVAAGKSLPLNRYLRFEEAIYLPGALDAIRTEARRDEAEYGFAQLRLVACFLRWSNLKEKPPERFDSPLGLLPVELEQIEGCARRTPLETAQ